MIGTEDRTLNPWARFAKGYGFPPLFGGGNTKIQPVYVIDVVSAIISALKDDGTSMGKTYELGGPEIYTIHELAELMFDMIRERPHYVRIPFLIAKASAMAQELLLKKVPFPSRTPSIFNLDQIAALTADTLVSKDGTSPKLLL